MKRFKDKRFFLVFILLFGFIISSFGQKAAPMPALFTPDQDAVELKNKQTLNDKEFIYYAFRFSGLSKENSDLFVRKYEDLAKNLSLYFEKNKINMDDPYKEGETILLFLHDNILKKYVEMETRLDELFNKGVFNCVSSGIIYYALALHNNLDVRAIRTRDHAFCAIIIDGKIVDVETTTKYGFDPGNKKEFKNSFGRTGFVYTPPSNYKDRQEISNKEFLSLILQNRISELQHKGNYTDTIALAVDRNAVLGTASSEQEMINEFKNHSVELSNKGDYKGAVTFLSLSAALYDYNPVLTDTASKLFYNQIVRYLEKNRIDDAMNFYKYFESDKVVTAVMKQDVLNLINQKDVYNFIQKNEFGLSRSKIIEYYGRNLISLKDKNDYLVFVYSREIKRLSDSSSWVNALNVVQKGAEDTENDSRIVKLEENIKYNIGVVYHNKFANLYNNGDKKEAIAVLEEGLKIVPDNKTLLSDMQRVKK